MPSLGDLWQRLLDIQQRIQDIYQRVWAVYTFINDLASYLLKRNLLGQPGVILGTILYDLWHWNDTTGSGWTIGELVTRMDVISAKLDTALSLLGGGQYGIVVAPVPPGSQGSIGDAVWSYYLNTSVQEAPIQATEALSIAYGYARTNGFPSRYPMHPARWFYAELYANSADQFDLVSNWLAPDFTAILPDDTVGSWLNRVETQYGDWRWDSDRLQWYTTAAFPGHIADVWIYCTMTQSDLRALAAGYASMPLWPGLDNVTLGTPVALSEECVIDVPCDGVLVAFSTPPATKGAWVTGDLAYYLRIGEITFVSDNGDAELFQYLGYATAVYVPRSIAHPAGARIRCLAGEGTATPWTVAE